MAKDENGLAKEIRYLGTLVEQVLHEVQATNEGVTAIHEELANIPKRDEFEALKQDVATIKLVITATNRDVADLDQRVTRLEGFETA